MTEEKKEEPVKKDMTVFGLSMPDFMRCVMTFLLSLLAAFIIGIYNKMSDIQVVQGQLLANQAAGQERGRAKQKEIDETKSNVASLIIKHDYDVKSLRDGLIQQSEEIAVIKNVLRLK